MNRKITPVNSNEKNSDVVTLTSDKIVFMTKGFTKGKDNIS